MNHFLRPAFVLALTALLAVACQDDDKDPVNNYTPTMYIVGELYMTLDEDVANQNPATRWKRWSGRAALWVDGELQLLGDDTSYSSAYSIAVSGSDIYVAGSYGYASNVAMLWKNGQVQQLSTGGDTWDIAYSVARHNGKTYAAGWKNEQATLWTDDVAQQLSTGTGYSSATAVVVDGNNVYVSGCEDVDEVEVATIWLNGEPQRLSTEWSTITDMVVYNGKIYAIGVEEKDGEDLSVLWVDGQAQYFGNDATFNSIAVADGKVYIAGSKETILGVEAATVWVNGVAKELNGAGKANGVAVYNDKYYVVGYGSTLQPTLWIEGEEPQELDNGGQKYAWLNDIVIQEKK